MVFTDYSIRDKSSTLIGYNVHPNPKQGSFEAHAYKVDFGVKMTEQYGLKIVQKNYDINGIYKDSDIININEIELNQLYEKLKELVIKQSGDFKLGADQSFREYIFPSGLSIDISSSKKPPWSNVMIGKRGDWITVKNMGEFSQVINKAVTKVKNEVKIMKNIYSSFYWLELVLGKTVQQKMEQRELNYGKNVIRLKIRKL